MDHSETDYRKLLETLETWTREGHHVRSLSALAELNFKKIPRAFRCPLALIASRIQQPLLALKIMSPVLHSEHLLHEGPSDQEKLVYANALTLLGGLREAKEILLSLDLERSPEGYLTLAHLGFRQWNYRDSLPFLRSYIQAQGLTEYARIVGKLNLAAALIAEVRMREAIPILESILAFTHEHRHHLLHANALELMSQIDIHFSDYAAALKRLAPAEEMLQSAKSIFYFYVIKWRRLAKCLMQPQSETALAEALKFRELSVSQGYWEIVRSMDLYVALIRRSEPAMREVLWGTPYMSFRKHAERLWGGPIYLGDRSEVSIFERTDEHKNDREIRGEGAHDLRQGPTFLDPHDLLEESARHLARHPLCSRAFSILCQDRYQSVRLGTLYSELYPGERLDPFQMRARVYNVLVRLRALFRAEEWPLAIDVRANEVRLAALKPNVAVITRRRLKMSTQDDFLRAARAEFAGRSFTAASLAERTGMSKSYCLRALNEARKRGVIEVQGERRGCRYRFCRARKKAA
ncbi:MAG: hypothetical protein NDI61_07345 [Bdellovibrionaceae bacterium]|nr:hypothetical protein [Pseudobdellovibrionaceae bacterium]